MQNRGGGTLAGEHQRSSSSLVRGLTSIQKVLGPNPCWVLIFKSDSADDQMCKTLICASLHISRGWDPPLRIAVDTLRLELLSIQYSQPTYIWHNYYCMCGKEVNNTMNDV